MKKENFEKMLLTLNDDDLIFLRVLVDDEMTRRDISVNVGDLGEKLVIDFFNSTPGLSNLMKSQKGSKNVDALSRSGDRYSIKTIMKAKKTGTVYPDDENPVKQLFEHLLLVRLNLQYQLESIHSFTWEAFMKVKAWDKRMNAFYVPVSKKRLQLAKKIFPRTDAL
jgi:hypothetical protein